MLGILGVVGRSGHGRTEVLILPAIDLRGGQCVRLRQGHFDEETIFSSDPVAVARRWAGEGARCLHIVDLDGARDGRPLNGPSVRSIVEEAGLPCQLGGGLREDAHIAEALACGVDRVVLGTRALDDPGWFETVCRRYPERITLAIDARQGKVAANGWARITERPALDLARRCAGLPLAAIIYTDIGRDGMLAGPNLAALSDIAAAVALPIIASGGVTTLDDVRHLARLGLGGCIIGRALYEGRLKLPEVIEAAGAQEALARTGLAAPAPSRSNEPLIPEP
jgi:phosphoribosylformimino-5-aminoimidazole carboxamide ribotide isomerase